MLQKARLWTICCRRETRPHCDHCASRWRMNKYYPAEELNNCCCFRSPGFWTCVAFAFRMPHHLKSLSFGGFDIRCMSNRVDISWPTKNVKPVWCCMSDIAYENNAVNNMEVSCLLMKNECVWRNSNVCLSVCAMACTWKSKFDNLDFSTPFRGIHNWMNWSQGDYPRKICCCCCCCCGLWDTKLNKDRREKTPKTDGVLEKQSQKAMMMLETHEGTHTSSNCVFSEGQAFEQMGPWGAHMCDMNSLCRGLQLGV